MSSDLPIHDVLPELLDALRAHGVAALQAPPGAGKSTQVPTAILDAGLAGGEGSILVLQPRRVAARALASRIASERGERVGQTIGYSVRFERKVGENTRVVLMTEGTLLRQIQRDPLLDGVACVVLDEFHERSLHADLLVAMLREVREVRDDLLLLVMSATLQTEAVCAYLDAPAVVSQGRLHPVDVEHVARSPSSDELPAAAAREVQRVAAEGDGDVLVFMPGARAIRDTQAALSGWARAQGVDVRPLYGALDLDDQLRAISPGPRRKVIVSTNIAETSLTVEGVTAVVDSGLVKQLEVSHDAGIDRLVERRISLASATQRAGRAGRVRPGRAVRLWTRHEHDALAEADTAAIHRVDLTESALEVVGWSGADPAGFDWFERPPDGALERAVWLLERLGALDRDRMALTPDGERLLGLPAHPRLGRLVLEGARLGLKREAAAAAAILGEGDFAGRVSPSRDPGACDLWRRVGLLDEVASGRTDRASRLGMRPSVGSARRIQRARDQLARMASGGPEEVSGPPEARFRRAVARAYPDRVCVRRPQTERDYVMVGGEPVSLAYESCVHDAEVIAAPVIAGARSTRASASGVAERALVRVATELEPGWLNELFPERVSERVEVSFDADNGRVVAHRRERFDGIVLSEQTASVARHADPMEVAAMLAEAVGADLTRAFALTESDHQLIERLACLAEWDPELGAPVLSATPPPEGHPEATRALIASWCYGRRSFSELRKVGFSSLVMNGLDHRVRAALDSLAPERMEVPTGSRIKLTYQRGEPPVLAVRIQEVFGWTETPRVGGGRQPVCLHLLAPNYRPAQVTQDLESFWENTYPEVRKELRARYSKHAWPEDPLTAKPERKGRSSR
jgi:ATP-dependent helicase HrpB